MEKMGENAKAAVEKYVELDHHFHKQLVSLVYNKRLSHICQQLVGQSHTRHLYRKNTLVMSFREAQRREIFGYKASLDPTEKISRSYRRSK